MINADIKNSFLNQIQQQLAVLYRLIDEQGEEFDIDTLDNIAATAAQLIHIYDEKQNKGEKK